MQLVWSVFALTVATLTLVLAGRRLLILVSELVFARYVAVGGMVAFSVERQAGSAEYRVRFEVGGPGVFHNVSVGLHDWTEMSGQPPTPPQLRFTMHAGVEPVDWTFRAPDADASCAWVLATWVRPYLQGVESEAIAQRLNSAQLYEWRWYPESTRYLRTVCRYLARRYPRFSNATLRELALYGRWRKTTSTGAVDLLGPADRPPPK